MTETGSVDRRIACRSFRGYRREAPELNARAGTSKRARAPLLYELCEPCFFDRGTRHQSGISSRRYGSIHREQSRARGHRASYRVPASLCAFLRCFRQFPHNRQERSREFRFERSISRYFTAVRWVRPGPESPWKHLVPHRRRPRWMLQPAASPENS
jgi:hypothetical protein